MCRSSRFHDINVFLGYIGHDQNTALFIDRMSIAKKQSFFIRVWQIRGGVVITFETSVGIRAKHAWSEKIPTPNDPHANQVDFVASTSV